MAPPGTESISYAEAVKYAEKNFPDVFRNLPPDSAIGIETIPRSASFDQPPTKRYRIHLGHNKQLIPGSCAKDPIWFEFHYVAQDVERIMYNCCKDWSDDRAQQARAEWYGPVACIVASRHGNPHLCLVVLSLYYIMQSGHATSCAVHLQGWKTGFLGTFKGVCNIISAARPVPKPIQAAAECPTRGLHGNQIAFLGGLPQPHPSTNRSNPVTPAKRRPSDPRSAEYRPAADEAPMIPSPLGFARPQKKTRPVPCASALRAESDEQALKSIQQSLQSGRRAEADLEVVRRASATMAAQLDALQNENNGFKIANEQLNAQINNLNTANDRLCTEKRAADLDTADIMRRTVAERDAAQNTVKDLGACIAARDLERASGEGRLKNQIAALESEKTMLKARNGDLEEQVEKLEKVFEDTVGGFEAYKKGIRRAGE